MDKYTDTTCCLLQNLVTSNILYYTWKHERVNWLQNNGISLTQRYCQAHELACTVSTQHKRKIIHILFFKFIYIHTYYYISTRIMKMWSDHEKHYPPCYTLYFGIFSLQNENCSTHNYTTKPKFTFRTHS